MDFGGYGANGCVFSHGCSEHFLKGVFFYAGKKIPYEMAFFYTVMMAKFASSESWNHHILFKTASFCMSTFAICLKFFFHNPYFPSGSGLLRRQQN